MVIKNIIVKQRKKKGLEKRKNIPEIPLLLIPILIALFERINDPSFLFIFSFIFRMSVKCEMLKLFFLIISSLWHLNKSDVDSVIFLFEIIGP